MRIIGEIETRRVARAPNGVDPEGTDLPIAWNRAYQDENHDQPGEEKQESVLPPPATVRFAIRARRVADWRRHEHRLWRIADWRANEHRLRRIADWRGNGQRLRRVADWRGGCHGFWRGAGGRRFRDLVDWRDGCRGFWGHRGCRSSGIRHGWLFFRWHGIDRPSRLATGQFLQLCPCGTDWRRSRRDGGDGIRNRRRRQLGKPLLQLFAVGWIRWLGGTPRKEAHLRPPYRRPITALISPVAVRPCRCDSPVAKDSLMPHRRCPSRAANPWRGRRGDARAGDTPSGPPAAPG